MLQQNSQNNDGKEQLPLTLFIQAKARTKRAEPSQVLKGNGREMDERFERRNTENVKKMHMPSI